MSVSAMESQCIKTIMIHLLNKSDFILSDHQTRCKSLQYSVTRLNLRASWEGRCLN